MGSSKEHARLFPNLFDNREQTIASSGTEVTFDFVNSGTDTTTTFYYGFGSSGAYQLSIRPSATVLIKSINGITLTDPITVTTAGYSDTLIQARQIVLETTADSTNIKLFAKGGN